MIAEILLDLLTLFAHPLLYLFTAFAFFVSYQRVQRERNDFHVRFYGVLDALIDSVIPGLLMGLAGSMLLVAIGTVLPFHMIVFVGVAYVLLMLTLQRRLMSPAFAVALAALLAVLLPDVQTGFKLFDESLQAVRSESWLGTSIVLGVLLLLESLLIRIWSSKTTSPKVLNGKRGKVIGAHEANRFWIVPLCLFIPGAGVIPTIDGWPLTGDSGEFSLLLVPFGVGFYRVITHTLPQTAVKTTAKLVMWLGIGVTVTSSISLYTEFSSLALASIFVAGVGRLIILFAERIQAKKSPAYFTQRNDGLFVLGILPNSPAEKIGVHIGELIQKVNGITVKNEIEFYKALQENAAYCKLEVVDTSGELRFAGGALYGGQHHQLGLLFVSPSAKKDSQSA